MRAHRALGGPLQNSIGGKMERSLQDSMNGKMEYAPLSNFVEASA